MALTLGARLGPYEILGALGVGGMGEVYRARDTKLNRDVALKILPDAFVSDPDRLARFTREAQTLAALNHPNIAHIHGLEEDHPSAGSGQVAVRALVMELVAGEDLSDRIARGPIPLDEALPIARQIAEALEAAHAQGIIHRDLKPANIKVRDDGAVKVLDFGLAKAMDPLSASSAAAALANSPTLTTPAMMTGIGVILGTAAYMSPEQARGKVVDKRTDLWAFGCVLYEMLIGVQPFGGEDVTDTIAAVVRADPDWSRLPPDTPTAIRRLLRRCLEKDRTRRLPDAADARLEIDEASQPTVRDANIENVEQPVRKTVVAGWPRALPWAVAGLLGVAALLMWAPWRSSPVSAPRKLLASIGVDASLPTDLGASAILSPDGSTFAFAARQAGQQTRLFIRKLDQLQAGALAGTEDAANPFFSPDGQWIAFFAGGQLKRVSVTGGAPFTLCDAPQGRGGTWMDDGTIIFAPTGMPREGLLRVSTTGGTPVAFGSPSVAAQLWPQALPRGKGVLYTSRSAANGFDAGNLVVAPMTGGAPKIVMRGGYSGRYVPSGHLVYMQQTTLFAVPFDLDRLETIGEGVPALDGLFANPTTGGAQLALSSEGTLAYVPGAAATSGNPIDWMTRDGGTSVLRARKANWANPRFSPDGQKLAVDISDGKQRDIFVYEWARDTLIQLTFDAALDRMPVWTPDGRRIVFSSDRDRAGIANLYWVNADGTGQVSRLTDSSDSQVALSWHPNGKSLVFHANRGATRQDLMILSIERDDASGGMPGKPTVFLSTPASEFVPMFSPDGRWVAYASNEAGGAFDVYVRPFPGPGGVWRVSTEGGIYPHWSATAHELLFVNQTQNKVMVAPYAVVGDSFRADKPRVWSPTTLSGLGANSPYDLHPDGKRLALAAERDQASVIQDKVVFVFNFFDYLRKIAPGVK